ncbi:IS4 family transposase [Candidatus Desantisbacteria bacterium CG_4_10_14_0_8_um_filter_48_22]|uniref:IS4 family transposase n=2 Tax=Bacteria candidate phyla TaxID=1783234 RepID=A0A2M7SCQ9_9BACT|nr:MAG: IS4 family transposase [Candidatus Desantisbacteria bacterium CG_4_10_14_0_8_um_filter_48_22]
MYTGRIVFAQLMDLLPLHEFQRCVQRYQGDYKVQSFSCLDQFLCMAFAQLTYRESLRDIQSCLRAMEPRLYHMGIRGRVSRSTLAYANETRDWRIYADFAQVLIGIARNLYLNDNFGVQLKQTAYAFDSTTIDLCLELFPWAKFRKNKAAIKLHTLLNLRGSIPEFIHITVGRIHDVNILDLLITEPGSFYVMDRGYLDFKRLYTIHQSSAFFVTRAKRNLAARRRYSRPVDKTTGLRSDQTIVLTGIKTARDYPEPLRRISYRDPETGKHLVFLANNFTLPALTIALLFKARWRVELFFKWIKQHLRIKAFFGTSENAVKTQVWIAVSVYVLVAILKKRLQIEQSLYTILQVLSISQFEKEPLYDLLSQQSTDLSKNSVLPKQLTLFN